MALPKNVEKLFHDRNFGVLVTRRADGSPHSTPVWIETDGEQIWFNTNTVRAKYKHLQNDPWVSVTVLPSEDLQSGFVTVYGRAVDFDQESGDADIDRLSLKYLGQETYPWRVPGEQRVTIRIQPERFDGYGVGAVE